MQKTEDTTTAAVGSLIDRVVRAPARMLAWRIYVCGWGPEPQAVTMATSRSKAIAKILAGAQGAGYGLKWPDFRAHRSPEHDHMFEKHGAFSWSWNHAQAVLCAERPNVGVEATDTAARS